MKTIITSTFLVLYGISFQLYWQRILRFRRINMYIAYCILHVIVFVFSVVQGPDVSSTVGVCGPVYRTELEEEIPFTYGLLLCTQG